MQGNCLSWLDFLFRDKAAAEAVVLEDIGDFNLQFLSSYPFGHTNYTC